MAVQAIYILNQRKQALNTRKVPGLTSSIENEALRAQPDSGSQSTSRHTFIALKSAWFSYNSLLHINANAYTI